MMRPYGVKMHNQTIAYYNTHAQAFNENTQTVSFAACQQRFLQHLPVSARILDFGCGSGRDTNAFSAQDFQVEALDGSAEQMLWFNASAYDFMKRNINALRRRADGGLAGFVANPCVLA